MRFLKSWGFVFCCLITLNVLAQDVDTGVVTPADTALRIINLNPYFTLHVDSSLSYQFQINKGEPNYFWYIRNAPVGLRINKDNGLLSFRADRSYFLSGKLKYDVNYNVNLGVQNLSDPSEKIDTSITIVFYNTEIIASKVKPTVNSTIRIDEGETVSFRVLCETGSFPIEDLITLTSFPLDNFTDVKACGETFSWKIPYEFVKESDSGGIKTVNLSFIGATKFRIRDTAFVRVIVRNALNYPVAVQEYNQTVKNIERYVLQLKYTFLQLDKRLKKTRSTRATFDLTSATTSLTGTIMATASNEDTKRFGQILPSVGLALVPIKEAAVPNKMVDQNQASLVRTSIKRLEYILGDNTLIGERDHDIVRKGSKLREELKQVQVQLIDVPIELTNNLTEEELNRYFNSPKVTKKYRLKAR
jgi:hypothetical protein